MSNDLEAKIQEAVRNPQNLGEMAGADAVGQVGSENCGDMLRMWVKFKEENGRKVIDKATFQTFGCQTAIAVASVATELIRGKTPDEALSLSGEELSAPLGALPPMKSTARSSWRARSRTPFRASRSKPHPLRRSRLHCSTVFSLP